MSKIVSSPAWKSSSGPIRPTDGNPTCITVVIRTLCLAQLDS